MNKKYIDKKYLYTILFFIVFFFIVFIFLRINTKTVQSNKSIDFGVAVADSSGNVVENEKKCIPKVEERIVRGSSMTPFLKNGDTVKVDFNYYNCGKKPQPGDVVIYDFKARDMNLIKVVVVVPGDKFSVNKDNKSLTVNGKELTNKEGKIYRFNDQNIKMLSLYEKSFNGIMKKDLYFIFGDKPGGIDSGKFGAINIDNILGKVLFN